MIIISLRGLRRRANSPTQPPQPNNENQTRNSVTRLESCGARCTCLSLSHNSTKWSSDPTEGTVMGKLELGRDAAFPEAKRRIACPRMTGDLFLYNSSLMRQPGLSPSMNPASSSLFGIKSDLRYVSTCIEGQFRDLLDVRCGRLTIWSGCFSNLHHQRLTSLFPFRKMGEPNLAGSSFPFPGNLELIRLDRTRSSFPRVGPLNLTPRVDCNNIP